MTPIDVFISHATGDDNEVTKIAEVLAAANLTVWVDHLGGLGPGMRDWRGGIQEALDACKCGILVWSPRAVKREEVDFECEYLLKERKPLPFFLLILEPAKKPYYLTRLNHTDLTKDWQRGLDAVAQTIGKRLGLYPPRLTGDFPTDKLELTLIGRDADVAAVEQLLATPIRAVAVRGLGGVGKTRLTAEVVERARKREAIVWRDGIVWHRIEPHTTADDLIDLLRAHFRLKPTKAPDAVWGALRGTHALLVLDNAEACADRRAYADRLNALDPAGRVRILMTSRARWPELRSCEQHPMGIVSAAVGEAILNEMLRVNRPMQPLNPAQVAEVADAAFYHPGLMEWAVRWLHKLPVGDVVKTLHELKGHDAETALEEMVGRTVKLVEQEPGGLAAIVALRRLAVCRGGCTPTAAQHLADLRAGGVDVTALLHAWGLLDISGARYELSPLVLAAVEEDADAHLPHYEYYKELARQHNARQDYAGLDLESANLEAAFEWALATGEVEKAYRLTVVSSDMLQNRGRFAQFLAWLLRVDAALPALIHSSLRAAVDKSLGIAYATQLLGDRRDNLKKAIAAFEAALRHRTEATHPFDFAMTQNNLGNTYDNLAREGEDRLNNLRKAIAAFEAALRHYTQTTIPLNFATTQNNLGVAYWRLARVEDRADNLRRAIAAYEAALRHRTESAVPLAFAMTKYNLGLAYKDLSQVEDRADNLGRAIEAHQAALRYYTELTAPFNFAMVQANLGIAYKDADELAAAVACWQKAEPVYREGGDAANAEQMRTWIEEAQAKLDTPLTP